MRTVAVVIVAAFAVLWATGAPAATQRPLYKNCVRGAKESHDLTGLIRAVWARQIPAVFARVNRVQHREVRVTQANTFVVEAIALSGGYTTPETMRLRKTAVAACSASLAGVSWVLRLYFSESPVQNTTHLAFVARTREGWRIWLAI
jgi:hypothetical protein